MNQKSSARPPDHGILKKELLGYTGICLVLLLLLGTGERLFDTFPVLDSGGSFLSGENRNFCGAHHRKPASGLYCRMELSGGRHDRAGGDPAGQPHVT